jgi:hypothetical protein
MQTCPPAQSVFVVHSFFGPGSVFGAEQTPLLQTVPFGQVESSEQVCAQPALVHTDPGAQLVEPVQGCACGADTDEHP